LVLPPVDGEHSRRLPEDNLIRPSAIVQDACAKKIIQPATGRRHLPR
jgi:hypothetical protein